MVSKYLTKTAGVLVGGLGRQKMVVYLVAHMLISSLLFVCEHLFTFQFSVLMPKISKENFAFYCNLGQFLCAKFSVRKFACIIKTYFQKV